MFELYLFTRLFDLIASDRQLPLTLNVAGRQCQLTRSEVLLYACLDTSILMCRALLHFMGIKHDRRGLINEAPIRANDVFMEPHVTVGQAIGGSSSYATALLLSLKTANKGVGHLTKVAARTIAPDLMPISVACKRTNELLIEHLYKPLGEPTPDIANIIH